MRLINRTKKKKKCLAKMMCKLAAEMPIEKSWILAIYAANLEVKKLSCQ